MRSALTLFVSTTVTVVLIFFTLGGAHVTSAQSERSPSEPSVLVVGDSLAVGLKPSLDELLNPMPIVWDARAGRTGPQGLIRLRARLSAMTPEIVVISLGTNDGPDPRRFTNRIQRALRLIPAQACVVWADIYRPPRKGSYWALNRALRAQARIDSRLHVVNWNAAVASHRVYLPDGLHPNPVGFMSRSRLFANAIQRYCLTEELDPRKADN